MESSRSRRNDEKSKVIAVRLRQPRDSQAVTFFWGWGGGGNKKMGDVALAAQARRPIEIIKAVVLY